MLSGGIPVVAALVASGSLSEDGVGDSTELRLTVHGSVSQSLLCKMDPQGFCPVSHCRFLGGEKLEVIHSEGRL